MKKTSLPTFVAVLTLLLALVFTACSPLVPHIDSDKEGRLFYSINILTGKFYSINAVKLAEGEHCIVYADEKEGLSRETAEAIVQEYEAKIYTQVTNAFGMFEDVDGNGKLILLLLDIIDGSTWASSSYVAGFFQSYHLFKMSTTHYYSNQADMIFLDTYPQTVGSKNFYSTIAHEFQHLINFSQTVFNGKTAEDIWINEGLSTAAEYIYNDGHRKRHIDFFNQDPYKSIRHGNNFFVWNGYWEKTAPAAKLDPVANYATAYLFFQWLRIHANNDAGIYKDIIASRYHDYQAITEVAQSRIHNSLGNWETLLRTWMLANAYNKPSGLLGYKGEIETNFYCLTETSTSLAPGEGVISPLGTGNSFTSGTSGNIHYAGFDPSSIEDNEDEPDILGPEYNGQYLLTFNANTNNSGSSETGYLAQIRERSLSNAMSMSGNLDEDTEPVLPGPFPIDVQFNPDGTKWE